MRVGELGDTDEPRHDSRRNSYRPTVKREVRQCLRDGQAVNVTEPQGKLAERGKYKICT
jgi:hypothetical protein